MKSQRASRFAFFGLSALLFAASAAATIGWDSSIPAMGKMPICGGRAMSTVWMRMPGQSWPGAAASFLGMWVAMMAAMMLPALIPILWRHRQAVSRMGEARVGRQTLLVGLAYFFVWALVGLAIYPLSVGLAAAELRWQGLAHATAMAAGWIVLIAGGLQFTGWKARHLARCREVPGRGRGLPGDAGTAWRQGLDIGLHCCSATAGLTAILLATGIMNLGVMAGVAAAITAERLAPAGQRVAQVTGAVLLGAGLYLTAQAAGLG
jgi:predicted metal-binding membrane protein